MDVFYYWKDINEDLKAQRIGYLKSHPDRLKEFQNGSPDYIWVFRAPVAPKGQSKAFVKGQGQVQLHARLRWSDNAIKAAARRPGESYLYYLADHADSVIYANSATASAVTAATTWVRLHLPTAINGNFQGVHGQYALRGATIGELKLLARSFATLPFVEKPQAEPQVDAVSG